MNQAVSRTAPTSLSANHNVNTGWNFQVTQYSVTAQNVSYDMWFHTIANPTSGDRPTEEVMIWPYRSGGAGPAGTLQATVTIAGATWQIYRGTVSTWSVFS
jgi:xyloglucan-specific endo-beta-1,4-glucanase